MCDNGQESGKVFYVAIPTGGSLNDAVQIIDDSAMSLYSTMEELNADNAEVEALLKDMDPEDEGYDRDFVIEVTLRLVPRTGV